MTTLTKDIIIMAAKIKNIKPYIEEFKPKDLGLIANNYGSFSDYCDNTKSSKWNTRIILKATKFNKSGKPTKYLLI